MKKGKIIVGVLVFLVGVYALYLNFTKVDIAKLDNLSGRVEIIGHAGSFHSLVNPIQFYPANSMAAIKQALKDGAEGIEVDLQMTKDSVLVLYHDHFLQSLTNESGCIPNKYFEEIQDLQYVLGFPYDLFHDETIISFQELIDYLNTLEEFPKLYLDYHGFDYCDSIDGYVKTPRILRALSNDLGRNGIDTNKVFLIAGNDNVLRPYANMNTKPIYIMECFTSIEELIPKTKEYGIEHMIVKRSLLTRSGIEAAHQQNIYIHTFGIKSRAGLSNVIKMDVDAIQTDNVPALVNLLK
ncbi:MAG: hypothetical protein MRY83_20660 [Flavobacteriales bacterium]|nr:hypothetical protein [Flavobacteriales bacterium]